MCILEKDKNMTYGTIQSDTDWNITISHNNDNIEFINYLKATISAFPM